MYVSLRYKKLGVLILCALYLSGCNTLRIALYEPSVNRELGTKAQSSERYDVSDAGIEVFAWPDAYSTDDGVEHEPASAAEIKVAEALTLHVAQPDIVVSQALSSLDAMSREHAMWLRQYMEASLREHLELVYDFKDQAIDAELGLQTRITVLVDSETLSTAHVEQAGSLEQAISEPAYSAMLIEPVNIPNVALEFIFSDKSGKRVLHLLLKNDLENNSALDGSGGERDALSLSEFGDALDQGLDFLIRRLAQAGRL
jgi:hypothetical protein